MDNTNAKLTRELGAIAETYPEGTRVHAEVRRGQLGDYVRVKVPKGNYYLLDLDRVEFDRS